MKRILIDARGSTVRTAVMTADTLRELYIDTKTDGSQVGRVLLGTVQNILPSQFAFIDIGREKNAFMNLTTAHKLKVGQPVLVQVYKDASGSKGANVGEQIHFNGRLTILYKSVRTETGVSHKITDKAERERLRAIAARSLPPGYGVILRTNSEGKPEAEIRAEIERLAVLSEEVTERAKYLMPPTVLYQENTLLHDLLSDDVGEIVVNTPTAFEDTLRAVTAVEPSLAGRVVYKEEKEPSLFEAFGVERQIERALQKNLWLPCGGFVTFEQTEACVIVDVNTGKFAGKKDYRETVLKTNLEAAECVAEQLALRNLSGMIIIDFIDMRMEADKQALIRVFTDALKRDRIKTDIVGMTELGLVQVTRRKTRPPLSQLLERECPHCHGTGRVRR